METSASVVLPHGLWVHGQKHSRVSLRAVDAGDNTFLVESMGLLPAHRINTLLARCLRPLDAGMPESLTLVRSLAAGDRQALLLHLRRLTFGDTFTGIFRCVKPACAEPLELNLRTRDLLLPPYTDAAKYYSRTVNWESVPFEVCFRLPTAGDLEEAASLAREDPETAARGVLSRCVRSIECAGQSVDAATLAQPFVDQIAALMANLDQQAVIEFDMTCPACGTLFSAQLDPGDYLLRELDQRVEQVLHEVHTLALWYHWSEDAILAMPQVRRNRYLELIGSIAGKATS
jgi:hypothetical protein